jgi:hypothetical protein
MTEFKAITFNFDNDPQVYTLAFDFNLICEAEIETGCNLMSPIAGGGGFNATVTRALLYGLLKKAHPTVKLSECGDLLSQDLETTLGALYSMVSLARCQKDEPEQQEPSSELPVSVDQTAE